MAIFRKNNKNKYESNNPSNKRPDFPQKIKCFLHTLTNTMKQEITQVDRKTKKPESPVISFRPYFTNLKRQENLRNKSIEERIEEKEKSPREKRKQVIQVRTIHLSRVKKQLLNKKPFERVPNFWFRKPSKGSMNFPNPLVIADIFNILHSLSPRKYI